MKAEHLFLVGFCSEDSGKCSISPGLTISWIRGPATNHALKQLSHALPRSSTKIGSLRQRGYQLSTSALVRAGTGTWQCSGVEVPGEGLQQAGRRMSARDVQGRAHGPLGIQEGAQSPLLYPLAVKAPFCVIQIRHLRKLSVRSLEA